MSAPEDFSILLVENNPDHAELTLRAIEQATGLTEIFWVKDGEEALNFLNHQGAYTDPAVAPRPDLVLLDLKLPKIGGHEVLSYMKAQPSLQAIPVVMLTTSTQQTEAAESSRLGAESFISKPTNFAQFVTRLRAIDCLQRYVARASIAPPHAAH